MATPDVEAVCRLEELAFNAWPASEVVDLDGWRLRYTGQVTRRANSVWPNATGGRLSLDEKLAQTEAFYADRNSPARFQICPAAQPADLDSRLADRGYRRDADTLVQTAEISLVLSRAGPSAGTTVTLADRVDSDWFSVYAGGDRFVMENGDGRWGILQRIQAPAA
jgi:hypothetical protein